MNKKCWYLIGFSCSSNISLAVIHVSGVLTLIGFQTRLQIRSQVPNPPHWDDPDKSRSTFPPDRIRAGPSPLPQWIGEFFCPRKFLLWNILGLNKSIFTMARWVFAHLGFHMLQVVGKWRYEKLWDMCRFWIRATKRSTLGSGDVVAPCASSSQGTSSRFFLDAITSPWTYPSESVVVGQ